MELCCSCSAAKSCLWPHGLRHVRLSYTSSPPGVCWNFVLWDSDATQPFHPLSPLSPLALSLFQSQGLFQWVSYSHQTAKVLEFELQHQSSQWIFRTDFLTIDWFVLLAVQGTFKSLLQHHRWKATILRRSVFLIVQLSHPYMTTGKTIALTRWTFVGKVMSLLFNMLSRLVITFLPRSKHLLISWLQSPFAVILGPPKVKSVIISIASPSIGHKVLGLDAMILVFWMLSFKPTFSLSFFTFNKRLFCFSSLSAIKVVSFAICGCWYFSQQSWFLQVIQPSISFDVICI